jgi:hypothetical protein
MGNKEYFMNSFYDTRGNLWVACSECERGLNGSDKDKCSCARKKKFDGSGCFCGQLMPKYEKVLKKSSDNE